MFDQLVLSSQQRRKQITAKYFFGTGALYVVAIACAFCVSILVSDPKLADTSTVITLISPSLPRQPGTPRPTTNPKRPTRAPASADIYHVQRLDQLLKQPTSAPPTVAAIGYTGDGDARTSEGLQEFGNPFGVKDGHEIVEPAPRPDPPKPRQAAQTAPLLEKRPIRVTSSVLQGKATERRTPIYPPLAQKIRLQGEVSVEVMIAPDGRVESARIVSGHPMLADKARDAALGWRFQPTLLNNVPVRVKGVIVFVFKLNDW